MSTPQLQSDEWYESLYQECVAILTEYSFLSRWSRVEGYWALGSRILQEHDNFEREKIYGKNVISKLSKHLGVSDRTLEYAVAFAKKFPKLEALPMGKQATWTMVCEQLLPEVPRPQYERKKIIRACPHCGGSFLISRKGLTVSLDTPSPTSLASPDSETHTPVDNTETPSDHI